MKKLIAKWLGVHQQLEDHEQRCRQLVAQRDANRDLATEYARQLTALEEQRVAAIALIRTAHRTMNLQRSGRKASQAHLKEVLMILDGAR